MTVTPPRRVGRPRKDEAGDTRALLLAAALDLFVEHGYAATSVRMIARAAGLSDGGLYAHFANKDAIYRELTAQAGVGAVDTVIAELLPDPDTPPDDPRGFLTETVDRILDIFDTDESRKFTKLLLRQAIPNDPRLVTDMLGKGAAALAPYFPIWADRGQLTEVVTARLRTGESTGEALMWELLAPLGFVRLVYLHGPSAARAEGRRRAHDHLAFFLAAVVRDRR
ncbi:TetR/AcrR family transcriptional regulator [Nocardia anaemiae]|uniref:TetR/AcrR family transcriptional regulator n=1 Tax=Nocardia anaemiae TaxID=263910 RepID=UPI0007A54491|nr:TetR/AcrR family transcriptional regulator [Nocardia anaemiae]